MDGGIDVLHLGLTYPNYIFLIFEPPYWLARITVGKNKFSLPQKQTLHVFEGP